MFSIPRLCHTLNDTIARMPEETRHWIFQTGYIGRGPAVKQEAGRPRQAAACRPDIPCHGTGNVAVPKANQEHTESSKKQVRDENEEVSPVDTERMSHFSVTQPRHLYWTR